MKNDQPVHKYVVAYINIAPKQNLQIIDDR